MNEDRLRRLFSEAYDGSTSPKLEDRVIRALPARPGILPAWMPKAIAIGFPVALGVAALLMVLNSAGKVNLPLPFRNAPAHASPAASPHSSPAVVVPNLTASPLAGLLGPTPGNRATPGSGYPGSNPTPTSGTDLPPSSDCSETSDVSTLLPGGSTYSAGAVVQIILRVHNRSAYTCKITNYDGSASDACEGRAARVLDSNGTEVWSSRGKCKTGGLGVSDGVTPTIDYIAAGATVDYSYSWNQQVCEPPKSNQGCTGPAALSGGYSAQAYIAKLGLGHEADGNLASFRIQ